MKYKEIPFKKALLEAAKEAGVSLENTNLNQVKQQQTLQDKLVRIHQKTATLYHQELLKQNNSALDYLKNQRFLTPETIEKFYLGYAPDEWQFLTSKISSLPQGLVKESGLVRQKNNNTYDWFRNRIVFPIFDVRGSIVAFGSRVIREEDNPKYLNSPETKIFKKKEILYGLNFGVESVREKGFAYVVEGYMDVIMLHQAGFTNAVAPLGTAFGPEHLDLIARYAREAVLVFDGDEAGKKAAFRSVDIALRKGFPVSIVNLPEGMDPFDFIVEKGKDAFTEYVQSKKMKWDSFLMTPIKKEKDPILRRKEIIEILRFFKDKDPFISSAFIEKLSDFLDVDKEEIQRYFQRMNQKRTAPQPNKSADNQKKIHPEMELVFLMLNNPELYLKNRNLISEAFFVDSQRAGIVFKAFQDSFEQDEFRQDLFFASIPEELVKLVGENLYKAKYKTEPEKQLQDMFIFLRLIHLKEEHERIIQEMQTAEQEGRWEDLKHLSEDLHHVSTEEETLEKKRRKFGGESA
jgi:DNA primase